MPPSFSFATTFGSFKQQALEVEELKCPENRRINIQLPQFPGYNTFNSHTQAPSQSNDSLLEGDNIYNSYGSIYTDHTGRSLDTLDVLSCNGAVGEDAAHNEEDLPAACKEEDCENDIEAKVIAAVRETSTHSDYSIDPGNNEEVIATVQETSTHSDYSMNPCNDDNEDDNSLQSIPYDDNNEQQDVDN